MQYRAITPVCENHDNHPPPPPPPISSIELSSLHTATNLVWMTGSYQSVYNSQFPSLHYRLLVQNMNDCMQYTFIPVHNKMLYPGVIHFYPGVQCSFIPVCNALLLSQCTIRGYHSSVCNTWQSSHSEQHTAITPSKSTQCFDSFPVLPSS